MAAKLADNNKIVIGSFIYSRPARHEFHPCFVRPTANELADKNKIVIGSFIYSRPARHEFHPCFVRPTANELADNKTAFCYSGVCSIRVVAPRVIIAPSSMSRRSRLPRMRFITNVPVTLWLSRIVYVSSPE